MARVLTQAGVDALLRNPPASRRETPDGKTRRLYFVTQRTGAAAGLQVHIRRSVEKADVGPYPAVSLAKARALAAHASARLADGATPEPRSKRQRPQRRRRSPLRPRRSISSRMSRGLYRPRQEADARALMAGDGTHPTTRGRARWGKRRLSTIAKAEVYALIDTIADRAPVMANRTLAVLKALGSWAADREIVAVSPFARAPPRRKRQGTACSTIARSSADEGARRRAFPFGPLTRLLLMLGARRGEVSGMRWSEIDFATKHGRCLRRGRRTARRMNCRCRTPPSPSSGVAKDRALGPRFSPDGTRLPNAFDHRKAGITRAMEAALGEPVRPFTYHDLRRSAASGMASIGVSPHVIEKILNHSGVIRGVALTYNRFGYGAEMRSALEAWSRRLAKIASGKMAGNVVAFHK